MLFCVFVGMGSSRLSGEPIVFPAAPPEISGGGQMSGGIPLGPDMIPLPESPVAQEEDPLAPPVGFAIEGINFDEGAANSGFFNIPPDPIGAAGPNHLVSVVNTSIEWHTKAGVQQNSQRLGSGGGGFFAPLAPANGTFDPKVIYDQHAGRFVVVTLERVDNGLPSPQAANTSRILVAVSDDSDPNGTWRYLAINSKTVISGIERWADYPGLAVDEEAIYITNNLFSFNGNGGSFGGVRLWIVNKTPLYAGGVGTFTVQDPYAAAGIATTTQPAHIFGTPAGATGTFLVSYSGLSDGTNEFLQVVRVDNPLTAPTFAQQFIGVGNIDNTAVAFPNAPQQGTAALIATNDSRAINAVWRNNRLWTSASVLPVAGVDAGQVTAHWWELNTTNLAAISVVQQGNAGGEAIAAGAYTFFPSVMVDVDGNMGLDFAVSAPTIFPSMGYTGRLATDPLGTVQPEARIANGVDFYLRTFGGPRNRWGDYSGIALDPADGRTFWLFNEYALARGTVFGGEDGRWGTRWGAFTFLPPLALQSAVSRRTHGGAGDFDISLPLGGGGVECRTGPYSVRFTFNNNIASVGSVVVAGASGTPTGTASISGNVVTVALSGVNDLQVLTITLNNVTDVGGGIQSPSLSLKVLQGDVNAGSSVNISDINLVKAGASPGTVDATNFRRDVNASGAINISDVNIAKSKSGNSL